MRRCLIVAFTAVAAAGVAWAQSLGELAERERQKQKERKPRPARVYTDDDLPRPTPTPEGGAVEEPTSSAGSSADSGGGSSLPSPDRQEWQQRAAAAREKITQARARIAATQETLDKLKSPFHVLHPYGHGNPAVPATEAELAGAKEALVEAEAELTALEKEAAAARVPRRWLEPQ